MAPGPIDLRRTALVLVDYQARLMPAIHEGERVVARALVLADAARELGVRVLGTEQNPRGLGPNVAAIRERCEDTLEKMHFDGCGDGLAGRLGEAVSDVVIAGCEAHVCLMQTAFGLLRAGYRVWVATDACGSRSARDHELAMQCLRAAGATLTSVEMTVFEWLGTCEHPRFKAVLRLLKEPPGA